MLLCHPDDFDAWLRLFDDAIAKIGVTRGSGPEVKSEAKLVCKPGEEQQYGEWATAYVRDTCKNPRRQQCQRVPWSGGWPPRPCFRVNAKRQAIASLNHPAAELVLTRTCADVCNITYWMRCYGDRVPAETCEQFDLQLRRSLEDTLGGGLHDAAWWQATLGVKNSGLGLRTAHDSCLPAFIGSRVSARPLVESMLQQLQAAGLGTVSDLLTSYDARTDAAVSVFLESLPENARGEARLEIDYGYEAARKSWALMQSDEARSGADAIFEDAGRVAPSSLRQIGSASIGLVQDAGAEDAEHPFGIKFQTPRVQSWLSRIVDSVSAQGIRDHYEQLEEFFDVERLDDLRHAETDHSWLWSLSAQQGIIVEDRNEFVEAVRVRLGGGGPPATSLCTCCGQRSLDRSGAHASCCAPGESTRGHNATRDVLYEFAAPADPSAEKEPEFLIPSRPRDRPADVLTSAVPGCVAALDVGIASPAAAAAGDDAAQAMRTNASLCAAS